MKHYHAPEVKVSIKVSGICDPEGGKTITSLTAITIVHWDGATCVPQNYVYRISDILFLSQNIVILDVFPVSTQIELIIIIVKLIKIPILFVKIWLCQPDDVINEHCDDVCTTVYSVCILKTFSVQYRNEGKRSWCLKVATYLHGCLWNVNICKMSPKVLPSRQMPRVWQ